MEEYLQWTYLQCMRKTWKWEFCKRLVDFLPSSNHVYYTGKRGVKHVLSIVAEKAWFSVLVPKKLASGSEPEVLMSLDNAAMLVRLHWDGRELSVTRFDVVETQTVAALNIPLVPPEKRVEIAMELLAKMGSKLD
jgi:hypothetical protein